MTATTRPTFARAVAPRRCCRRARGFTLLEVVLASAMMALLALSLYSTLRVAYRARDGALAAVGPARSAEIAIGLVQKDIESALPPTGQLAGAFIGDSLLGTGTQTTLQFYAVGGPVPKAPAGVYDSAGTGGGYGDRTATGYQTPSGYGPSTGFGNAPGYGPDAGNSGGAPGTGGVPMGPSAPGIRRIELTITHAPDAGENVLVRRTTRNLLSQTESLPEEEIICRGVTTFTVRYFDGTQWVDTWDSGVQDNTLPAAVEVTLGVGPREALGSLDPSADPNSYTTSRVFFLACRRESTTSGFGFGIGGGL